MQKTNFLKIISQDNFLPLCASFLLNKPPTPMLPDNCVSRATTKGPLSNNLFFHSAKNGLILRDHSLTPDLFHPCADLKDKESRSVKKVSQLLSPSACFYSEEKPWCHWNLILELFFVFIVVLLVCCLEFWTL